jgi:hypothetical protein
MSWKTATIKASACVVAALVLTGCVKDPYNDRPRSSASATSTPTATATQTPAPSATAASPTPAPPDADQDAIEAAVRRFAERYINWDWDGFAQSRRDTAAMATGDLRTQLLDDAGDIEIETSRRSSGQSNQGRVEGVLIQPGKPIFVITREMVSYGENDDEGQRGYFIYLADVKREDDAWKLSEWQSVSA